MEQRKSNIELLRIISIFLIIIFHCAFKSGFEFGVCLSVNKLLVKTFYMFGELGVNLFVLIFGYFMVNSRFRCIKLIRLLAEVQFYHWIMIFVACKLDVFELTGWKNVFLSFFPVTLNYYWFITAYIIIYILSTYFNILIHAMDKKTYQKLLGIVLILYCVIPSVLGLFLGTTESILYYNRMIWMVVVYFLGAYIQKYGLPIIRAKKEAVIIVLFSSAILMSSILVINKFHDFFVILGTDEPAFFWPPNTVPMILLSIGIFGLFLHLKISYHRGINIIASTTLGIYLLHDGILASWIWRKVFRCVEYQNSPFLIIYIFGVAILIFVVGVVIDLLRQKTEQCIVERLFNWWWGGGMKLNHFCMYFKKNISIPVLIFGIAFVIYIFLGICISYKMIDTNIFFGADNARVFEDLACIRGNHYRTKVHPLFLLLAETVILFLDGIINYPEMSVILLEAFCGAISVSLFYSILERMNTGCLIRGLFTFIYSSSFSMLIFSTVPETFIFSSLGMISFWYFLVLISERNDCLSNKEFILLMFFGIISFGFTLTNYIFYIVGMIHLLLCRYEKKEAVKIFFKINIVNIISIIILCGFQRFVWTDCPFFWTSIIDGLCGYGYEETQYMDWSFTFPKTMTWIKQIAFAPLLSSDMYLRNPNENYHPILFSGYALPVKLSMLTT